MAQRQFRSDDTSKWTYGFGNGADGDLTISSDTTEAPIDSSCSGTAGETSLSATNASFAAGQLILIHQTRGTGAGSWELNRILSYTAGTITTSYPLINTYTDSGASQAQVRVMKQYNNVTIDSGKTYTGKAWDGNVGGILAFFAKGTTTVTGNISTSGKGFLGATLFNGSSGANYTGEGTAGASVNGQSGANGNGGGGGDNEVSGQPQRGGGGGGGNGTAGTTGTPASGGVGGTGGAAAGVAALTTAVFGGGGGDVQKTFDGGSSDVGGNGGGMIFIFGKNITITGTISTSGLNGASGSIGGGGGAGGSVLLKTQIGTFGTNLITVSAGVGGNGNVASGGAGSVGRIHLDYKTSYTGTTDPTIDATQDATLYQQVGFLPFL